MMIRLPNVVNRLLKRHITPLPFFNIITALSRELGLLGFAFLTHIVLIASAFFIATQPPIGAPQSRLPISVQLLTSATEAAVDPVSAPTEPAAVSVQPKKAAPASATSSPARSQTTTRVRAPLAKHPSLAGVTSTNEKASSAATSLESPSNNSSPAPPLPENLQNSKVAFSPPTAFLEYNTLAIQNGDERSGNSHIFWQTNNEIFSLRGQITIDNEDVLSFMSDGMIDPAAGVLPTRYTEQRRKNPAESAFFRWDQKIAWLFSSHQPQQIKGGEQNCASILWQLIGMGRQNNHIFRSNTSLTLTVFDTRESGAWQVHIIGQENLTTSLGQMSTWHVSLTPPKGSPQPKLDAWLAQNNEWYPIKLLYTYSNGNSFDLQIREITPIVN